MPFCILFLLLERSSSKIRASSFLLSLLSPVLHRMLCGDFKESASKEIRLDDVQENDFMTLLWLACGDDRQAISGEDLFKLGVLAARLGMTCVVTAVEDILLSELKTESCLEMLRYSEASGLEGVRRGCHIMLRDQFQKVSESGGFSELSEETLSALLEDDLLGVIREEAAYEVVLGWMKASGERSDKPLRKIRYGLMDDTYLAGIASTIMTMDGEQLLRELVGETMTKKGTQTRNGLWDGVERLCDKWKEVRKAPKPLINLPAGTILGADVLKNPSSVVVDREGCIIVSDCKLHQILVFNSDGCLIRRLGSQGIAPGQFDHPNSVAVDRQGRLIVADWGNHRIQVLNSDGSVDRCFGNQGAAIGQFHNPASVAVDRDGRMVVADSGNCRIQVFNADGSVARHFGSTGASVGELDRPVDVAVDEAGRIVVADTYNHRVQVFNGDGSVALCFGSRGEGPGQFNTPGGVAVDREGSFVVADCSNHRVQVFNSDGSVARVIGTTGAGVGQLKFPYGVAVDGAGRILVVECGWIGGNHRVQVF